MLMATPTEIIGKIEYRKGKPTATCELNESEQKVFDDFCKAYEDERNSRFEDCTK